MCDGLPNFWKLWSCTCYKSIIIVWQPTENLLRLLFLEWSAHRRSNVSKVVKAYVERDGFIYCRFNINFSEHSSLQMSRISLKRTVNLGFNFKTGKRHFYLQQLTLLQLPANTLPNPGTNWTRNYAQHYSESHKYNEEKRVRTDFCRCLLGPIVFCINCSWTFSKYLSLRFWVKCVIKTL